MSEVFQGSLGRIMLVVLVVVLVGVGIALVSLLLRREGPVRAEESLREPKVSWTL